MGHGGDEEGTTEEWRGVTGPGRRGQARSTGHDPFPLRSKARRPFRFRGKGGGREPGTAWAFRHDGAAPAACLCFRGRYRPSNR
jgi:hypothetical protein